MEAAFRALIGYPGEETIEGADIADNLLDLLRRVSHELLDDEKVILPGTAMERLRHATHRRSIESNSYDKGAQIVLDDLDYWHTVFSREVDKARRLVMLMPARPRAV